MGILCAVYMVSVKWFAIVIPHITVDYPSRSLWEHGHTVVGVEAARPALEEFFEEQSIKYTASDLPDGLGSLLTVRLRKCYKSDTYTYFVELNDVFLLPIFFIGWGTKLFFIGWGTKLLNYIFSFFQSEDGRIKLYCCDLFKFNRYWHI